MKRMLLGLVASAALAAPATASAALPVPAPGTIEHSISTMTFEGNYSIEGKVPRSERFERWVTADSARQVITNGATGKLLSEGAQKPGEFSIFDAVRNELATGTGAEANSPRGTFIRSLPSQGADIGDMITKGWMGKTGDTTYLGRPAITLSSTSTAPGEGAVSSTFIVDAETLAPYKRVTTGSQNGRTYTQTETVESFRTLPLAGNEHLLTLSNAGANAERITFTEQGRRIFEESTKPGKSSAASKKKKATKKSGKAKSKAKKKSTARR